MSKICCTFAAGKGLGKKNGPIKGTFFLTHPIFLEKRAQKKHNLSIVL